MGMMVGLAGRLVYLCVFRSVYYSEKADDLHERERGIKAARGRILDANGEVLAANRTVCTISVIHSQIEEPEAVIAMLVKELGISEETARKRVEKRSSIERVKTNVDKKTGDTIRSYGYAGVKKWMRISSGITPKGSWRRALSASPEAIIRASSDWRWNMRKF